MEENKKEKMKNWLDTGFRETDEERLTREKKSLESFEKAENLLKHGKRMTDIEIIQYENLKKIINEFLNRLAEIEQLKNISKEKKFQSLLTNLKKIIEITLDEIKGENNYFEIDNEELNKKLELFNLEFEKIKNFKDTNLKETNKERAEREKRVDDASPYRQYDIPLTPRDKDY